MRHIIIGTSGHIDHGKTTLIKALTGTSTDKLKEEQQRGISINLGFTYFDLPSGLRAGIIDVPGHERFVKNMLSGVVGMDLVLLIIAADDGVMPQTIEHSDILEFMGVENLIFVVTKTGMVEPDMLNLVIADIRENFKHSRFKDSKIIPVDSLSGKGIDNLVEEIDKMVKDIPDVDLHKSARLNVDRSFSLKGIGTIVTGTLIEGKITKDTPLTLYPSEKEVKVRSIEVHDTPAEEAVKGQRTALNIINLKKDEIERGMVIAKTGSLTKTSLIDVKLTTSTHQDVTLKHFTRVRLFHGTKEIMARVIPLDKKEIAPGETQVVQLRLEEEIYAKIGDPFVIRLFSPMVTVGGGIILETFTKRHTFSDKTYLEELKKKELDPEYIIISYLKEHGYKGASYEEIYSYIGYEENYLKNILEEMTKSKEIFYIGGVYVDKEMLLEFRDELQETLTEYHKENPFEKGINKEVLRAKLKYPLSTKFFADITSTEIIEKILKVDKTMVSLKGTKTELKGMEKQEFERVMKIIKDEEPGLLKEPDAKSLFKNKKLIPLLSEEVKIIDGFVIRNEFFQEIIDKLMKHLEEKEKITVAEFRDLIGFSRKNAIAILEYLDREKFTRRDGDFRYKY